MTRSHCLVGPAPHLVGAALARTVGLECLPSWKCGRGVAAPGTSGAGRGTSGSVAFGGRELGDRAGVIAVDPASATPIVSASFEVATAHPGEIVALDVTFTNPETVDVIFTYSSVNQSYDTMTDGTRYSNTGCTGQVSWCNGGAFHFSAPIAPGASRSATLTYQIAADSPCGENVGLAFFFYNDRESAAGPADGIAGSPVVTIVC